MVLKNRPNFFLSQSLRCGIVQKSAMVQVAEPTIRTDPNVAVTVFYQHSGAEISQTIALAIIPRLIAGDPADTLVGCDPNGAVSALCECTDKIVHQHGRSRVVNHA